METVLSHGTAHLCTMCHIRDDGVCKGTFLCLQPVQCERRAQCSLPFPDTSAGDAHRNGTRLDNELVLSFAECYFEMLEQRFDPLVADREYKRLSPNMAGGTPTKWRSVKDFQLILDATSAQKLKIPRFEQRCLGINTHKQRSASCQWLLHFSPNYSPSSHIFLSLRYPLIKRKT